jgi:hypothetical protein
VKILGWLILMLIVGAALMWVIDHWGLIQNRGKISGANNVLTGINQLLGGA